MRSGLHREDGVGVDNYEIEGLAGACLLLGHPVLGEIDVAEGLGGGKIGRRGDATSVQKLVAERLLVCAGEQRGWGRPARCRVG
jgi:hypothetical protein